MQSDNNRLLPFCILALCAFLALPVGTANARGIGNMGSDLGNFGDLLRAPKCEFKDKEEAKCKCTLRSDDGEDCLEYAVCGCDPDDEAEADNCACTKDGEAPEELTNTQIMQLVRDKIEPQLSTQKVGEITVDDDVVRVMLTDLSGAPFYEMVIDRIEGRERRMMHNGEKEIDYRSKIK